MRILLSTARCKNIESTRKKSICSTGQCTSYLAWGTWEKKNLVYMLGSSKSSCGFCLRRLSPNKDWMLAMYDIQFNSFRFLLSDVFVIFWFQLMIRNFQDQNYEVSSWEKWTIPKPSPLRVKSRLQSCRGRPKTFVPSTQKTLLLKEEPKNGFALQATQFWH
jgi:hypothetical protein